MEKLPMQSRDRAEGSVAMVAKLWPHCVTEAKDPGGGTRLRIDFDKLRAELTALDPEAVIGDGEERYQFTWPDKRAAAHLANTPTTMTLRPVREASVDFDRTENLYIEGDNLDVLKCLRENYLNAVKMIYIDPPYNTGKDFVYNDDFSQSKSTYEANSGAYDEDGNLTLDQFQRNLESNGRFHTDWLNMIYPRIKVARDFLTEDGVIFISVDDSEVDNLRKICDEIFFEKNFIAQIVVNGTPKNDPYVVSTAHEYCLVYCKNIEAIKLANFGINNPVFAEIERIYSEGNGDFEKIENALRAFYEAHDLLSDNIANYKYADKDGVFRTGPIDDPQSSGPTDDRLNPKTGRKCATPARGWSCTLATWNEWVRNNLIWFPDNDEQLPAKKTYAAADRLDVMRAYFKMQTRKDTDALKRLFRTKMTPFSNPKPVELLKQFIKNCNDREMTAMDFFSGSGSFAHAMILQNSEDGGRRKFILVQLPELIKVTSSQSNKEKKISRTAINFLKSIGKPALISEIAKERIRRAGRKVKEEAGLQGQDLDIGFRVLRLDTSNMQDVYYKPEDFDPSKIEGLVDNIKPDRTDEDLLFQVMPQLNAPLSAGIEVREIAGKKVYIVGDGYIAATFDRDVNEQTIREIARLRPVYFVMRDASAANDNVLDNFEQLFRHYSPETVCKVI